MTRLNFLTPDEIKISSEFKKNGFIIRDAANKKSLNWIQSKFVNLIKKKYNFGKNTTNLKILNFFHKKISKSNLNSFRLKIYNSINKVKWKRLKLLLKESGMQKLIFPMIKREKFMVFLNKLNLETIQLQDHGLYRWKLVQNGMHMKVKKE